MCRLPALGWNSAQSAADCAELWTSGDAAHSDLWMRFGGPSESGGHCGGVPVQGCVAADGSRVRGGPVVGRLCRFWAAQSADASEGVCRVGGCDWQWQLYDSAQCGDVDWALDGRGVCGIDVFGVDLLWRLGQAECAQPGFVADPIWFGVDGVGGGFGKFTHYLV